MTDTPLKQPRLALVIRVPRALEVEIEDAFLALSGVTRPVMGFHITVLGPFTWIRQQPETALEQVAQRCAATQPFDVTVGGAGSFDGEDTHSVYIPVHTSTALRELHHQLAGLLEEHIVLQREVSGEEYLPHVTLGLGLSTRDRDRALAELERRSVRTAFLVTELHLVTEGPGSPWRSSRVFPLADQPLPAPHSIYES
ncbi:MAG: 2'-5' RNA ligase family protein [Anaerolineae bacterium]|jgi:2'-5' RNA ligase|nr:2'-5' RNA ligase family protein [Chloroflexota bacterium]